MKVFGKQVPVRPDCSEATCLRMRLLGCFLGCFLVPCALAQVMPGMGMDGRPRKAKARAPPRLATGARAVAA